MLDGRGAACVVAAGSLWIYSGVCRSADPGRTVERSGLVEITAWDFTTSPGSAMTRWKSSWDSRLKSSTRAALFRANFPGDRTLRPVI
jgi:hypothetical protein